MEEENLSLQTQKCVVPKDETKISKLQLQKVNESKERMERPQHKCIMLVFLLCEW